MAKDLNRYFLNKDIQLANKRCLPLYIIMETQIKKIVDVTTHFQNFFFLR